MVGVREEVADVVAADAGAVDGLAQRGDQLIDPLVELLLVEVQRRGDVRDFRGVPEAHLQDDPVLGVHRLHGAVHRRGDGARGALAVLLHHAVVGGARPGHLGHRVVGDEHRARLAHRQAQVERLDLGAREERLAPGRQNGDRLAERVVVARQHPLQRDGLLAEALGLGRGTPLAPELHAVLKIEALDDRRQIRREAAAPFELTDDAVVVLEQLEADVRRELVRLAGIEVVAPADEGHDPVDQIEVLDE